MWVKRAKPRRSKVGKPCIFDSYQNMHCVAVKKTCKLDVKRFLDATMITHFVPQYLLTQRE